jgi:hypothetical protein
MLSRPLLTVVSADLEIAPAFPNLTVNCPSKRQSLVSSPLRRDSDWLTPRSSVSAIEPLNRANILRAMARVAPPLGPAFGSRSRLGWSLNHKPSLEGLSGALVNRHGAPRRPSSIVRANRHESGAQISLSPQLPNRAISFRNGRAIRSAFLIEAGPERFTAKPPSGEMWLIHSPALTVFAKNRHIRAVHRRIETPASCCQPRSFPISLTASSLPRSSRTAPARLRGRR